MTQDITTIVEDGFIYDFVPNSFGYDSAGDSGQGVPQWYGSAEGDYPDMQDPLVETIVDEYIDEGAQPEEAEAWAHTAARKLRDAETFEADIFGDIGTQMQIHKIMEDALEEQVEFVYKAGSGPFQFIYCDISGSMGATIGRLNKYTYRGGGAANYPTQQEHDSLTRCALMREIILEGMSEGVIDHEVVIFPWSNSIHDAFKITQKQLQDVSDDLWSKFIYPTGGTTPDAVITHIKSQSHNQYDDGYPNYADHSLIITDEYWPTIDDKIITAKFTDHVEILCSYIIMGDPDLLPSARQRAKKTGAVRARSDAAKKGWATRREKARLADEAEGDALFADADAETFEAPMAVFPTGKHDITTSKARLTAHLKAKGKGNFKITQGTRPIYLTIREGSSNKFHCFMDTDKGHFNVYGRVGYAKPQVYGPMSASQSASKLRNKMRKGYQKTSYKAESFGAEDAALPYAEVGVPVIPNSWGEDSALTSGYGVPQWYGSAEGYKNKREQAVTEEAMSDVEYLREQYAAEKMGLVVEQPFKTAAWATAGVITAGASIAVLSALALGLVFRSE